MSEISILDVNFNDNDNVDKGFVDLSENQITNERKCILYNNMLTFLEETFDEDTLYDVLIRIGFTDAEIAYEGLLPDDEEKDDDDKCDCDEDDYICKSYDEQDEYDCDCECHEHHREERCNYVMAGHECGCEKCDECHGDCDCEEYDHYCEDGRGCNDCDCDGNCGFSKCRCDQDN